MVSLPSQSSYQAQSRRTSMGDGSSKGIARATLKKRRNPEASQSNSRKNDNPTKKVKTVEADPFSFVEYGSDGEDDFNPTVDGWKPDRSQKARMRKEQEEKKKTVRQKTVQQDDILSHRHANMARHTPASGVHKSSSSKSRAVQAKEESIRLGESASAGAAQVDAGKSFLYTEAKLAKKRSRHSKTIPK